MKTDHFFKVALVCLGLSVSACEVSQPGDTAGPQYGQPQYGQPQYGQQTAPVPAQQPAQPQPTPRATIQKPSPQIIQFAQSLGIPAVQRNSGVAGPFAGPSNTLVYYNKAGLITYYQPQTFAIYFGRVNPQRFDFIVTPTAMFQLDQNNQAQRIQGPPAALSNWPHAEMLATVLVQQAQIHLTQMQAQAQTASNPGYHYDVMSDMSQGMHQTSMDIIGNIGGDGCVDQYEGPYHVGCF